MNVLLNLFNGVLGVHATLIKKVWKDHLIIRNEALVKNKQGQILLLKLEA